MAYAGYRVIIDGNTLPEGYVWKGTYKLSKEDRIFDEFEDGYGIKQIKTIGTKRTVINLSLRRHTSDEHSYFIPFTTKTQNIPVTYYDDHTDSYKSGTFHMNKVQFQHENSQNSKLMYGPTPIVLEEY